MGICSLCGKPYEKKEYPLSFAKTVETPDSDAKEYWELKAVAHPDCIVKLVFERGTNFTKKRFTIADLEKTKQNIIHWYESNMREDATNFELSRDLSIPLEEIDVALEALEEEKILA